MAEEDGMTETATCIVCKEKKATEIAWPCGHAVVCNGCVQKIMGGIERYPTCGTCNETVMSIK